MPGVPIVINPMFNAEVQSCAGKGAPVPKKRSHLIQMMTRELETECERKRIVLASLPSLQQRLTSFYETRSPWHELTRAPKPQTLKP